MSLDITIYRNLECKIYEIGNKYAYPRKPISIDNLIKHIQHKKYERVTIVVEENMPISKHLKCIDSWCKKLFVRGSYQSVLACSELFNYPLSNIIWTINSNQLYDSTILMSVKKVIIHKAYYRSNYKQPTSNMTIFIQDLNDITPGKPSGMQSHSITSEIPTYKITSLDRLEGDICLLNPRIKLEISPDSLSSPEVDYDYYDDYDMTEYEIDCHNGDLKYTYTINLCEFLSKLPNLTRLKLKFVCFNTVYVTISSKTITDLVLDIENLEELDADLPNLINFDSKYESDALLEMKLSMMNQYKTV